MGIRILSRVNQRRLPLAAVFHVAAIGLTAGAALLFCASTALLNYTAATFSPDSWSYLDIANSFFNDFYRVTTIRQLVYDSDYAVAFPPAFPFLIAVWNGLFHSGIYAGYWLNMLIMLATLGALAGLSQQVVFDDSRDLKSRCHSVLLGFGLWSVLVANPFYFSEVISARAIPLTLLIALALLSCLLWEGSSLLRWCAAGALAGLACLTRFDFLIAGLCLGALVAAVPTFRLDRSVVLGAACYYVSFLAALSPWIIHSITRFGTAYASENVVVALATQPQHIAIFVPGFIETARDNFAAYAQKLAGNIGAAWQAILIVFAQSRIYELVLVAAALTLALFPSLPSEKKRRALRSILLFCFAVATSIAGYVMTGYMDHRYFVTTLFLLFLWLTFFVAARAEPRALAGTLIAVLALCLWQVSSGWKQARPLWKQARAAGLASQKDPPPGLLWAARCLPRDARVMMSGPAGWTFGPYTGITTVLHLLNWDSLSPKHRIFFLAKYRVTHLFGHGALAKDFPDLFDAVPCEGFELYRFRAEALPRPVKVVPETGPWPPGTNTQPMLPPGAAGAAPVAENRIIRFAQGAFATRPEPGDVIEYSFLVRRVIIAVTTQGSSHFLLLDGPAPARHRPDGAVDY
ncbi:MAG: hypothetical protein WA418_30900, partial [Bradyrhizobium sp.]